VPWRTEARAVFVYWLGRVHGVDNVRNSRILVVENVQETRDAILELLKHDGFRVDPARDEEEATDKAQRYHPDLILVSLGGPPEEVLATAQRIRIGGGVTQRTPIVIFSLTIVPEGTVEELAGNVHVIVPDNFDQLRMLLRHLLTGASRIQ